MVKKDAKAKETNEDKTTSTFKEEPPSATKASAKANGKEEVPSGFLRKLRPRRRCIFFCVFLGGCASIVALHEHCDVPKSKRQDCGYPDITPLECQTLACLTKGGGSILAKKNLKVSRSGGDALGLEVVQDKVVGFVTVTSIGEGAVMAHNGALPLDSEERIVPGDRIAKVDGTSAKNDKDPEAAHQKMVKALEAKGKEDKKVQLEIHRPKVSKHLLWLRSGSGKPNIVEKILTSPGSRQFARTFRTVGSVGLACWLLSGYPMASLPLYYGGISAAVAFSTVRCCHDEDVPAGTAHCYKPKLSALEDVLDDVRAKAQEIVDGIRKDPAAFFKRRFVFW